MRLVFGIMSLLVVLAVVGVLVKKQLGTAAAPQNAPLAGQVTAAPGTKNLQLQSRQLEQQIRQSTEAAMQRPRVVDEE